ncbi:MAG: MBL fold metallo-hydrolase [Candidatus Diapherotrites archaeon]|nr:MBL fold metallo-hydrolase [Candidatus Diapherotrites archaeon]
MFESVIPNVHVFYSSNYGSNIYFLIGRKIAVIDASTGNNAGEITSGLKSLKIKPEEVDFLLFTHGHADHFGCASLFSKAEKRMHELDAEKMALKDLEFAGAGIFGAKDFPKINSNFIEGEEIDLKPFTLKVFFTPGHTSGSVCFFEEKQSLLFSGDTLFAGGCGRTDLVSGNEASLTESIEMLSKLDFKVLLPGHGLILKQGQEANTAEVLKTLKHKYL